ncbi:hypothetical protein [Micromonospora cremea]|uniref:Uncharacterized protein n=1 Tax=Micromonospora cremea TaxID=709881 RepID=A0A1N5W093_9ACTN|nr:hypothetical protein [Micromonospora cremea]SIM78624.1 hypothetical protein SAMN04489832_2029 [Micromonospora cremea]
MTDLGARMRDGYGAGPRHLIVVTAAIVLAGWVALRLAGEATAGRMLLWFLGAVIAHDLVLFPAYATADRVLRALVRPRAGKRVALLNHLRVPALASALLFLVFAPGILRLGETTHLAATGQDQHPYLVRWLQLTVALFLLSALAYALRALPRRRQSSGKRSERA